MTITQIENFIGNKQTINSLVKIGFKKRNPVEGMFIETKDFAELKSKNFWRIVSNSQIDLYKKTKDINLSRIFNGTEMKKLSCV